MPFTKWQKAYGYSMAGQGAGDAKTRGLGGQASIGRGRKAARGMPTGQGNNALGLPEPRGM